mmetsp:Transcript_110163/g.310633  ORF Transcript_110163/g.310633 Transcript_110163/m.310633 type:complete len:264 (-) Transcript_110163:187-978(-)
MVGSTTRVEFILVVVNKHDHGRLRIQHILDRDDDVLEHLVERFIPLQHLGLLRVDQEKRKHAEQAAQGDAAKLSNAFRPFRHIHSLLRPGQWRRLVATLGSDVFDDAPGVDPDSVRERVAQRRRGHRRKTAGSAERGVDDVSKCDHYSVVQETESHEGQRGCHAHLVKLCGRWRTNLGVLSVVAQFLEALRRPGIERHAFGEFIGEIRVVLDEPRHLQQELGVANRARSDHSGRAPNCILRLVANVGLALFRDPPSARRCLDA